MRIFNLLDFSRIKEFVFSYFRHILEFSECSSVTESAVKTMKSILRQNTELMTSNEVEKLTDLGLNQDFHNQMKNNQKKENAKPLISSKTQNLKANIFSFKKEIKKKGMLQVIKEKMRKLVNKPKNQPEKEQDFQINDYKDFLEEFLLSENLKIADNKLLVDYLKQDEKNISILIKFITSPFSYSLSTFFVERHRTLIDNVGDIYVEKIRTFRDLSILENYENEKLRKIMSIAFGGTRFVDEYEYDSIQDKSMYYIRAFYSVMILTDKENHIFLSRNNSIFINQFFKEIHSSLSQPVIVNHMKLLIHLYRFYMLSEPTKFTSNFLRYGLVHNLLHNVDKEGVADFIVTLLNPFDRMQHLDDTSQIIIWRYMKECGFFVDLTSILLKANSGIQINKFDTSYLNSDMTYAINLLDHNGGYQNESPPLLRLMAMDNFYEEKTSKYYLIEEIIPGPSTDIDRIFEYDDKIKGSPTKINRLKSSRNIELSISSSSRRADMKRGVMLEPVQSPGLNINLNSNSKNNRSTSWKKEPVKIFKSFRLKTEGSDDTQASKPYSKNMVQLSMEKLPNLTPSKFKTNMMSVRDMSTTSLSNTTGMRLTFEEKKRIILEKNSRMLSIQKKTNLISSDSTYSKLSGDEDSQVEPEESRTFSRSQGKEINRKRRNSNNPKSYSNRNIFSSLVANSSLKIEFWFELLIFWKRRRMIVPRDSIVKKTKPQVILKLTENLSPRMGAIRKGDFRIKSPKIEFINPSKSRAGNVPGESEIILMGEDSKLSNIEQTEYLSLPAARII